jgi:hypothetical protein
MKNKNSIVAEQMRQHIEACKASNLTVVEYCKQHQFLPARYYYWQSRLKPVAPKAPFTQLLPEPIESGTVSIYFPNGVRMVFSGTVSCSSLKELACCI